MMAERGVFVDHTTLHRWSIKIVAVTLTDQDTSDESQVGALLEQIEPAIEQVTADDAYDGEPTYQTITAHDANIAVVIPPRQDTVPNTLSRPIRHRATRTC